LKWHRAREAHEAVKGQCAQLTTTPGKLDGEAKQLLRKTRDFKNQRRVT
jgi:hypothetical protein